LKHISIALKKILQVSFFAAFMISSLFLGEVSAIQTVAEYTAPDGFKVISYSYAWADLNKLKDVYSEIQKNFHGNEINLLKKIVIYPGNDPKGSNVAGRWYGTWTYIDDKPELKGNRYIEIYEGNEHNTIEKISRTLSHEYGHHFTYFYFFKYEQTDWDEWRKSDFATARGLKNSQNAGVKNVKYEWLVQEIAAEDYVQLFGSLTCKKSVHFRDISERLNEKNSTVQFSTDMYNYCPQENLEIPLASISNTIRAYWLRASGLNYYKGASPSQINVRLDRVESFKLGKTPSYEFSWDKSTDDKTSRLEYTLVWLEENRYGGLSSYPVKTVYDGEPLRAVVGAAANSNYYMWETIPRGIAYFVVYVKDEDGLITSSKMLAVDFTDQYNPDSVLIDNNSLIRENWFPPRVVVNSRQMYFGVPPIISKGRTLVPLRAIFEELGAEVEWDSQARSISAYKGNTELYLEIGSNMAFLNGEQIFIDVPPQIINGRTLVPLRLVSEALGAKVSWNSNLQLASIKQ
jgi:hypothetical protein